MVRIFLFLLLILFGGTISAQDNQAEGTQSRHFNTLDSTKRDGFSSFQSNFSIKSAIVPISLVTVGIIVETLPSNVIFGKERIQQHVQDKMNGFRTSVDDYLQFAPIGVMFGLKLAGTKSRSDLLNQMIITAKSEMLVSAIVFSMKHFISDWRPDGSADNTMPSGHTAQAFVSATLLDMEYREKSPWISVGGYLCATATGFFRVANNRHWASDVLIGAGIGIASVKLVYLTHQYRYKWVKMSNVVLVPTLYQKGGGVAFAMKF
jgi:hypothetical protein